MLIIIAIGFGWSGNYLNIFVYYYCYCCLLSHIWLDTGFRTLSLSFNLSHGFFFSFVLMIWFENRLFFQIIQWKVIKQFDKKRNTKHVQQKHILESQISMQNVDFYGKNDETNINMEVHHQFYILTDLIELKTN